jgi:hypothetical protein
MVVVCVVLDDVNAEALLKASEGRARPSEMPSVRAAQDALKAALDAARREQAAADAAGPEPSGEGGL